jgi:PhzF family phenazine biosynthesis protein
MPLPLLVVDAFARGPFTGNPAAVCLLPAPADAAWMQLVAREMNLSETAFVSPREGGEHDLRWFTPLAEVDLCGHATLATAHALWETERLPRERAARFHTRSGVLVATRGADAIALDFPAQTTAELTAGAEPETRTTLEAALGARAVWLGRSRSSLLVQVESEAVVRALAPDLAALGRAPGRAFIVTAKGDAGGSPYDFVSRVFAPRIGVPEDPVTGAAHCVLAPFWSERLGKRELVGFQASARGGAVRVEDRGDRVTLGGGAVTILRGELDAAAGAL